MKKNTIIGCLIIIVFTGVGYFSYSHKTTVVPAQASEQKKPPVEVSVYTVKHEVLVFTKDLPGRTSAFQIAEIRPQVSGIILKRMFTQGSLVNKGQQLYQIDSATYQVAYDKALAGLAQAQANIKAIEPKAVRYTRLVKAGGVSHQEYDDAMASLAQTEAGIAVAKAQVAEAKINLGYTRVFAPISGRIGRSHVTEGALVTSGQAMALATIQNLDQIYVDVNQPSQDLMRLRKQVNVQKKYPQAVLLMGSEEDVYAHKGNILFSDVTVDEGTGMVQVRIRFSNPENELLPGLFVKARIEQSRQDQAITIPQRAGIRSAGGQIHVWAIDESSGTVNTRPITVEKAIGDKWLVTSGLKPGDRIVVEGLQKIRPMAKVTPKEFFPSNS